MANYWHGLFPFANQMPDGWGADLARAQLPANGYRLHDMIGNVWEWTADYYALPATVPKRGRSCVPANPRGTSERESLDGGIPRKVLKGGSHLCAANYCQRYRPAARRRTIARRSTRRPAISASAASAASRAHSTSQQSFPSSRRRPG